MWCCSAGLNAGDYLSHSAAQFLGPSGDALVCSVASRAIPAVLEGLTYILLNYCTVSWPLLELFESLLGEP